MRQAIAVGAAPLPEGLRGAETGLPRIGDLAALRRREHRAVRPLLGPAARGVGLRAPWQRNQAVLIDAWDSPRGTTTTSRARPTSASPPTSTARSGRSCWTRSPPPSTRPRPGVPCFEVDAAARRVIEKAGYGESFTHRLGHGLGIDVHEPPYMVGHDRTMLEPGMTFTSEPGIYLLGPLRRAHRRRRRVHREAAPSRSRPASSGSSRSRPRDRRPRARDAVGPAPAAIRPDRGTCRGAIVFSLAHDVSIRELHPRHRESGAPATAATGRDLPEGLQAAPGAPRGAAPRDPEGRAAPAARGPTRSSPT